MHINIKILSRDRHLPFTRGTHDLIKQGAKLVANIEDILVKIRSHLVDEKPLAGRLEHGDLLPALTAEEEQIMALLDAYPVHIDTLARRLRQSTEQSTGQSIGHLAGTLSRLELKGMISQEPGKYFLRRPPAQPGIAQLGQRKDFQKDVS